MLTLYKPKVVMLLGREAQKAAHLVSGSDMALYCGPHPAHHGLSKETTAAIREEVGRLCGGHFR